MTKFLRSRRTKLGLYVAGIIVRQQYGIGVVVLNKSEETLRQVSVKFDSRGNTHSMPDLAANERRRVLVQPVGESSIEVQFTDASGRPHGEMVAGYVESGYCENAVATILPGGKAKIAEEISLFFCRRSWLDCITATAATPWSSTRNGGT
jgi:hypothetical protein